MPADVGVAGCRPGILRHEAIVLETADTGARAKLTFPREGTAAAPPLSRYVNQRDSEFFDNQKRPTMTALDAHDQVTPTRRFVWLV